MPDKRTHLAASVAVLFLAACAEKTAPKPGGATSPTGTAAANTPSPTDAVQCLGIHACKGQSACHVLGPGGHACAGQNACKGKGWISVPRAECTSRGGKVLEG